MCICRGSREIACCTALRALAKPFKGEQHVAPDTIEQRRGCRLRAWSATWPARIPHAVGTYREWTVGGLGSPGLISGQATDRRGSRERERRP